jgi:hypothetical protein
MYEEGVKVAEDEDEKEIKSYVYVSKIMIIW